MYQRTETGRAYGSRCIFRGTEIIRQIGGIPIHPLAVYTRLDGTLTGVVDVEIDGKQRTLPFEEVKKGEYRLVTEIGGREIYSTPRWEDLFCTPDGKLAGIVEVRTEFPTHNKRKSVPFVGEELKERIGGRKVLSTANVATLPDGRLIGTIILDGQVWREVPFVGDWVIKEWEGKEVLKGNIGSFPDGTIELDLRVRSSRFDGFGSDHEIYMCHPSGKTVLLYSADASFI